MRRRAALQPSRKSLAAHLASLNTCRLSGGRTFKVKAGVLPAAAYLKCAGRNLPKQHL